MNRLVKNSLLVGALFGVDKLAGTVRQALIARTYDVSAALDAYNAANNLPDAVVTLLAGGALAVAFIPVLTDTLDREGQSAMWQLFSRVLNIALLLSAACAVVLAVFAEPFVRYIVVPRFSPEQQALTASLMRVNLTAMLFFTLSGLATSSLQARQHFLLPGLAPILYNVCQIVGVLFLSPRFGIYGLAYGVILGAALHFAIQLPGLRRYEFQWTPSLDWQHPNVLRVARVVGPRILNIAAFQTIFVITDRFASGLSEGSVSALAYGWQILQMPQTVIGTAAATALLPALADLVARGDAAGLKQTLRKTLGVLLAITLPLTALAMLLIGPALQVAVAFGYLSANGARLVHAAALAFLPGLVGHSLVDIAVRAYYAQQQPWVPLVAAALTAIAFAALCLGLVPRMGHAGIALANTLAFTAEALGMLFILHRRRIL
jgi:putative peptidoglycan lipid II flippase